MARPWLFAFVGYTLTSTTGLYYFSFVAYVVTPLSFQEGDDSVLLYIYLH